MAEDRKQYTQSIIDTSAAARPGDCKMVLGECRVSRYFCSILIVEEISGIAQHYCKTLCYSVVFGYKVLAIGAYSRQPPTQATASDIGVTGVRGTRAPKFGNICRAISMQNSGILLIFRTFSGKMSSPKLTELLRL